MSKTILKLLVLLLTLMLLGFIFQTLFAMSVIRNDQDDSKSKKIPQTGPLPQQPHQQQQQSPPELEKSQSRSSTVTDTDTKVHCPAVDEKKDDNMLLGMRKLPFGATDAERACDNDLGYGLIERFKESMHEWCSGESTITCGRIQQTRHVAPDTLCFGKNIVIDYDKITSVTAEVDGATDGALGGVCKRNSDYNSGNFQLWLQKFMPKFMELKSSDVENGNVKVVKKPTVLVARDGYGNVFHTMADFFSVYISYLVSGHDPSTSQIVLLDNQADGPYYEQWSVFSGGEAPLKVDELKGQRVMYRDIVFALPSGSSPLWKDIWMPNDCDGDGAELVKGYVRYALHGMGMLNAGRGKGNIGKRDEAWGGKSENKPKLTLSVRQHKPGGKIGRSMINQKELEEIVKSNTGIDVRIVDLGTVPYMEQIKIIRDTDIYVGMHGAGMTYIAYLPPSSVIVEFFPMGWHQSSMRNLAQWTQHTYFGWRCLDAADTGPELATRLPPDDFKRMVNKGIHAYWGAVYNGLEDQAPLFK